LSRSDKAILKGASGDIDSLLLGGHSKKNSYQHAMSAPGQKEKARKDAGDFVEQNETKASRLQSFHVASPGQSPFSSDALYFFGMALHTVTDNTSPGHEGFQVWNGVPIPGTSTFGADAASAYIHSKAEEQISPERLGLAVGVALQHFRATFGGEMLHQATGGIRFGSEDDPAIQAIHRQYRAPGADQRKEAEDLYLYRLGLERGLVRGLE
jgi:hypothetical protein